MGKGCANLNAGLICTMHAGSGRALSAVSGPHTLPNILPIALPVYFAVRIDAGFDMVLRHPKRASDREKWYLFLHTMKVLYRDSIQVELNPHYSLMKRAAPQTTFARSQIFAFQFKDILDFARVTGTEDYTTIVTRIASAVFGFRVQSWNRSFDECGNEQLRCTSWISEIF
jgi:hypothetical protein